MFGGKWREHPNHPFPFQSFPDTDLPFPGVRRTLAFKSVVTNAIIGTNGINANSSRMTFMNKMCAIFMIRTIPIQHITMIVAFVYIFTRISHILAKTNTTNAFKWPWGISACLIAVMSTGCTLINVKTISFHRNSCFHFRWTSGEWIPSSKFDMPRFVIFLWSCEFVAFLTSTFIAAICINASWIGATPFI